MGAEPSSCHGGCAVPGSGVGAEGKALQNDAIYCSKYTPPANQIRKFSPLHGETYAYLGAISYVLEQFHM